MNTPYKLSEQYMKVIERLFVFVDTKDIDQNINLNLVVNPQIIKILLNQAINQTNSSKIQLYRYLSDIFARNTFNSLILAKRDRQIMQFNHSILQSLINFIFTIRDQKDAKSISNLLTPFIHSYCINGKILKTILSIVIKDFYSQKFNHYILELSIQILINIMRHQSSRETQPNCYFITYGEETGIKMIDKTIKWPFSKGFHLYMKFYIQSTITQDMIIFTISLQNDQFVVFITPDKELKIKVFAQKQIITISTLPIQEWITFTLSYTLKTKLLKNYYEIHCMIDGEMHERRDLPLPNDISMSDEIQQLSFGHSFYGLIHTIILSRNQINKWNKLVLNSWQDIQTLLVVNKKNIRDLFVLYHPLLTTCINQKDIIYEITSQNHGQIFQNTGIYINPFKTVDINYYGGLYTFLPYLHLLKFYNHQVYPQALTHIFELFSIFFINKFVNAENQAIYCQFFSVASQLINQINSLFITRQTTIIISQINKSITNMLLRKQFFLNFLWKIKIRKIQDPIIVQNILSMIQQYFLQFFEWSYGLISIDDIFHYIIDNYEPEHPNQCCFKHYLLSQDKINVDKSFSSFTEVYLTKTKYLKSILKIIFMNLVNFQSILPINTKIMEILFSNYSSCLKLLLLQSLNQGSKINATFYMQQFNLHNYLYIYLPTTSIPDQIALIIQCLLHCQEQNQDNQVLQKNIIHRIAHFVDSVYSKRCEDFRFRSRSDKIKMPRRSGIKRSLSQEKVTKQIEKRPLKKLSRGSSIENSKSLYEAIIKFCFYYDGAEFSYLLKHDEYVLILQPYFKICCLAYRKNIIEMIRNTVILASKGKSLIQNLTKFDRLYKMLLNQFVLRQLMPESPDYLPTEQNTYIIRNVYFVIDYMIMNIRNDWIHLYIYLLRLIGLLQITKKDIQKRTERSPQDIFFAAKVTLRKFILRVVKLAQKNIYNLPNLVFIAYLTIFSNELPQSQVIQYKMFRYYQSFQKYLFIGYSVVNSQTIDIKQNPTFVDSRLILQTVASFKICFFNYQDVAQIKTLKYINSYFDLDYTNEDSLLYKNRFIFLTIAQFKSFKPIQNPIKNIFNGFFKDNNNEKLSIGEILSIMLGLCIEASLKTDNLPLLKQSLKSLQDFFSSFALFCSRDGLKRQKHESRDTKLPKIICCSVLRFLYETIQSENKVQYKRLLQETLYSIFYFLGLLITCLSNKVGQQESIERCLQLAKVQKNVEEYNFYLLQLFNQIMSLKQIIQIPNIDKEKAINLIQHQKISSFFRNREVIGIEHKIRDVVAIHKKNQMDIKAQLFEQFQKNAISIHKIDANLLINKQQFQKQFVLEYLKHNNLNYRKNQRIWRKIWKRLRQYHYYWSISMNQRQTFECDYKKNQKKYYKQKFSKFYDENGSRSILQIEPIQPWHVKKILMQKQFEYRNSNYLYHLHEQIKLQKKKSSILDMLVNTISSDKNKNIFFVDWVKNNSKRKGYLSIQNQKLKFKYLSTFQKDSHLQFTSFILAQYKPIEKYWPLIEISDIIQRRYLTKNQCLLIQFEDHTTLIFNFLNNDKDIFLSLIEQKQNARNQKQVLLKLNQIAFYTKKFTYLHVNNRIEEATHMWRTEQISNFKYLMLINKYAGRSYLDPANYPVFPWIINSYDTETYRYRDLSKSVGALGNQQRRNHFKAKTQAIDPFDPVPPYQFGTHYSSPGMVFNFLIRLNPYTEASRTLQGGKFDLSDRLFNSIKVCWHSVNSQVSDVRQLIPQFYYMPECLMNLQQYNFGITQQKERVHNVHLPLWSKTAYDFISIHKSQLQSNEVSKSIHHWIDLIFGFKQKGKIAEQNMNLFFYLTYQNSINLQDIQNQQTKISKEAQVMHFGQTPSQIFIKPHPQRQSSKAISAFLTNKMAQVIPILTLQSNNSISLLFQQQKRLIIFSQYSVQLYTRQSPFHKYSFSSQTKLLRNNSRQNIYFLQDIDFSKKIILFGKNRFVAIGSYVNGDLIIYSLSDGKRVDEKKGAPKNCIFINKEENLLFCGCKNGLLQIYQIIYCEKEGLILLKIASQYYQSPIYSISEGGHFYSIVSGNLAVIVKISRTLTYVFDKMKMRGIKMLRSIQSHKNIDGSLICIEPLPCLILFNSLQISSYSINGQHLKTLQIGIIIPPIVIKSHNFSDYIVLVEDKKIVFYSTPFLQKIRVIDLPHKNFRQISLHHNKLYLCTNLGQVFCVSYGQKDQYF